MSYAVKDVFLTVQGEGMRAGELSVFVRFSGCNMWSGRPRDRDKGKGACSLWCDTNFYKGERFERAELLARMAEVRQGAKWCVLTGGEPGLQVDDELVEALHQDGWKVAIETNGTIDLPRAIDWVCISPKRSALELQQTRANELKVVLPGELGKAGWSDAELEALERQYPRAHLFVQPQDPTDLGFVEVSYLRGETKGERQYKQHVKRCFDFAATHPQWRIGFQGHKLLDLP